MFVSASPLLARCERSDSAFRLNAYERGNEKTKVKAAACVLKQVRCLFPRSHVLTLTLTHTHTSARQNTQIVLTTEEEKKRLTCYNMAYITCNL